MVTLLFSTLNYILLNINDGSVGCRISVFIDDFCLLDILFLTGHHLADAGDAIVLLSQIDEAHTLCSTSHDANVSHLEADKHTRLVDDHEIVLVGHYLDGYQTASLLGDGEGLDTLGTTGGLAVVFHL